MSVKVCIVIPARHASSRYPGKPLVALLGKPMILWVAELSAKAVGKDHVYVATDDKRIADIVEAAGFQALMTSPSALTGTDRLAEACEMIDYDIYVNVQGDEPVIDPDDIQKCIRRKLETPEYIVNGFCWISADEDPQSRNLPKVVANESQLMVYMSRAALPASKEEKSAPKRYMKQVCIYCFTKQELLDFKNFGRKSYLESCEDIEILRFLELGRRIVMVETKPGSVAVDIPEDVEKVEAVLRARMAR
ncbi:3-deoxy-manno-octulosonate cytidylyltransferase [Methylocystis sp. S23]